MILLIGGWIAFAFDTRFFGLCRSIPRFTHNVFASPPHGVQYVHSRRMLGVSIHTHHRKPPIHAIATHPTTVAVQC